MLVIIDLMGDEETVVEKPVNDDDQKRRQEAIQEIAKRMPQPELQIVPVSEPRTSKRTNSR